MEYEYVGNDGETYLTGVCDDCGRVYNPDREDHVCTQEDITNCKIWQAQHDEEDRAGFPQ